MYKLLSYYENYGQIFLFPLLLIIGASLAVADNVKEGNRLYDAGKYQEALTYFMKPDAQNDPETINLIGYMYQKGQGVKRIIKKHFFGIKRLLKQDWLLLNSMWD